MRISLLFALTFALLLATGGSVAAQEGASSSQTPRTLDVVLKPTPPFVMKDAAGNWTGISIELWRRICQEQNWQSEFRVLSDVPALLREMQREGGADVAVAAVTMTSEREKSVDFSHGFFDAGLGIAVSGTAKSGVLSVLERLISPAFLGVLVLLIGLLLLVGALLWLFERRRNQEQFGGSTQGGLGNGFWWAAVTMTTVGYGDKAPVTGPGRAVALVWMFASILLISTFTAAIASSLTLSQLEGSVQGPDDLPGARVAVISGTTGVAWCEKNGVTARSIADLGDALDGLREGELDAVLYDAPLLRYAIRQGYAGVLTVLPHRLQPSTYAFVMPEGSELKEPLDQSMLRILSEADWGRVVEGYLGRE